MTDEATLTDVIPHPDTVPLSAVPDAPTQERERLERTSYKALYEEMCGEKEDLAANLTLVHRELQMARRNLEYQGKVVSLQEEIIALLKLQTSWTWPKSPPINEESPF